MSCSMSNICMTDNYNKHMPMYHLNNLIVVSFLINTILDMTNCRRYKSYNLNKTTMLRSTLMCVIFSLHMYLLNLSSGGDISYITLILIKSLEPVFVFVIEQLIFGILNKTLLLVLMSGIAFVIHTNMFISLITLVSPTLLLSIFIILQKQSENDIPLFNMLNLISFCVMISITGEYSISSFSLDIEDINLILSQVICSRAVYNLLNINSSIYVSFLRLLRKIMFITFMSYLSNLYTPVQYVGVFICIVLIARRVLIV